MYQNRGIFNVILPVGVLVLDVSAVPLLVRYLWDPGKPPMVHRLSDHHISCGLHIVGLSLDSLPVFDTKTKNSRLSNKKSRL